jgi:hypothetical protein
VQVLRKVFSLPSGSGFLFRQFGLNRSLRGSSLVLGSVVLGVWAGLTAMAALTGINVIVPLVVVGLAALLPARYLNFRFRAAVSSPAVQDALESPATQAAFERLSAEAHSDSQVIAAVSRELLKTLERVSDDPAATDEVLKALSALADVPGVEATQIRVDLADGTHTYSIPSVIVTRPSLLNRLLVLPVTDQQQRPLEKNQSPISMDSAV